ncbi:MAG: PAS domain-containing protein [Myxococcales bacterium]|nr:PAS domain-containing protein [Myxococcales bacterium]
MAPDGEVAGYALEWHDVTALRAHEKNVERLRQAIDQASTALMMIDDNHVITYVNEATVALLGRREAEIRTVFPDFSAKNLVGRHIDVFHAKPEHQRRMLADINKLPHKGTIRFAGLTFRTNVSAVMDGKGNRIGSTMEWQDVTEQVLAEEKIEKLIAAAVEGNLSDRLDASAWSGFIGSVGMGVNRLLDAVSEPIDSTARVASALARGDLTHEVSREFRGAFNTLGSSINHSIENLRGLLGQIQESAANISQAANELNEGNTNLSSRTEEQAAALEQSAATVEELTSTVRQNAANAAQANQLASAARDKAERGGDVVSRAVEAMAAINDSSRRIGDIIGVIDEIAFQTNLLALNAAVEAARAGDQGRGFAVVATEVRNLAQRSAGAAKEIKSLIRDSNARVDDGTRLVDHSGNTLKEIITQVKKVSDIIAEIAAASEEQASGIEQVNQAVGQMDQMTQQNAALVEQAAAASASLDDQARILERLVRNFDLGRSNPGGPEVGSEPKDKPRREPPKKAGALRGTSPVMPPPSASDGREWEEF